MNKIEIAGWIAIALNMLFLVVVTIIELRARIKNKETHK